MGKCGALLLIFYAHSVLLKQKHMHALLFAWLAGRFALSVANPAPLPQNGYRKWAGYETTSSNGCKMSTRSYQRLAGDSEVIRIPARSGERQVTRKPRFENSVEEEPYEGGPFSHEGLLARKQNAHSMNPFGMGMVRGYGVVHCFICSTQSVMK